MCKESLLKAVKLAGGQSALADALNKARPARKLKQSHIWHWLNSPNPEKMPPADYCPDIEQLTGIPCEDLRPDVNWSQLRCKCREASS